MLHHHQENGRGAEPSDDLFPASSLTPNDELYVEAVAGIMRDNLKRVYGNFLDHEAELSSGPGGAAFAERHKVHLEEVLARPEPATAAEAYQQVREIARTFQGLYRFCKFSLGSESILKDLFEGYDPGPRDERGCFLDNPDVQRFCREGEIKILRALGAS